MRCAALVACLIGGAGVLVAQTERVPLRAPLAPNQTAHMRSTIALDLDAAPPPDGAPAFPIPIKFASNLAMQQTLTVGARDEQGRLHAQTRFDEADSSVTMNGQPIPITSAMAAFVHHTFDVTFDEHDNLAEVTSDSGQPADAMKAFLQSMFQLAPSRTIAVGETATVPLTFSIPLPIGGPAIKSDGETTLTLERVARDGADRIAHFAMTSSGHITLDGTSPLSRSPLPLQMDMLVDEQGTLDTNVDRGIVHAMNRHGNVRMAFHGSGPGGQPIDFQLKGTLTVTQQTTY